jgi:glucose/arabinose dehydrogenase
MLSPSKISSLVLSLSAFALAAASPAGAQQTNRPDRLKENFAVEHQIGHRVQVDLNNLLAPKSGPVVTNRPLTVPFSDQNLQAPPGFTVTLFAKLTNPRRLLVLPNGDVLVAEQSANHLTLLRDDGTGQAKWIERHVEDLNKPYGLAWRDGDVLVADLDGIWRVPHVLGALRAGKPENQRAADVPEDARKPVPGAYGAQMITPKGVFGIVQGHQNRHLVIDPRTGALFVGVGSSGNIGVEPEPKASIQRFDKDGGNQTAIICPPIISSACSRAVSTAGPTPISENIRSRVLPV